MSDRKASVENTLTTVIGQLESDGNIKKASRTHELSILDLEESLREATDPLEDVARQATTELNKLHSSSAAEQNAICEKCLATVSKAQPLWSAVSQLIPKGEFYRYSYTISPICKTFVTVIAFARFMLYDELVPAFTAANLMGLGSDTSGELQLTADDYLQGVIGMVNELPRLSINAVTAQNFALPVKISSFVNDVFQSYSMLNLRNDQLRRRFDSLKYDLKRCEDVVYDLTLRGLTPAPVSSS